MNSESIQGAVRMRNRMGHISIFRIQTDDGDVLVRFSRGTLGDDAYDRVRRANLGDVLRITGTRQQERRLGEVLVAETVTTVD